MGASLKPLLQNETAGKNGQRKLFIVAIGHGR